MRLLLNGLIQRKYDKVIIVTVKEILKGKRMDIPVALKAVKEAKQKSQVNNTSYSNL
jgi:hypothetical protein